MELILNLCHNRPFTRPKDLESLKNLEFDNLDGKPGKP